MKQIILSSCIISTICAFGECASLAELTKAAQGGNADAQHRLSMCYARGDGVKILPLQRR